MPNRTPKEKILATLEAEETKVNAEVRRWDATVHQYDADMIYNQEHGLPNLSTIERSRDLAKQESLDARELRRLYSVAIDAVRGA